MKRKLIRKNIIKNGNGKRLTVAHRAIMQERYARQLKLIDVGAIICGWEVACIILMGRSRRSRLFKLTGGFSIIDKGVFLLNRGVPLRTSMLKDTKPLSIKIFPKIV